MSTSLEPGASFKRKLSSHETIAEDTDDRNWSSVNKQQFYSNKPNNSSQSSGSYDDSKNNYNSSRSSFNAVRRGGISNRTGKIFYVFSSHLTLEGPEKRLREGPNDVISTSPA